MACSSPGSVAESTARAAGSGVPVSSEPAIRVRVRLFAIQRELAGSREVAVDLSTGSTVADAWDAVVALHPALAPGRASVRFARNGDYADAATVLDDRDEVAFIPPVSGGAETRILEIVETALARTILADLEDRLATDQDGAVVGFLGRTRVSPGTPAPGQEAEAARHAGRSVESLGYEAHETMAAPRPRDDRRRDRGAVRCGPAGDRPSNR